MKSVSVAAFLEKNGAFRDHFPYGRRQPDCLVCVQSKDLRERWLLDGAPSAGPEQDEVRRQLEQDEARTRSLEETINRSNLITLSVRVFVIVFGVCVCVCVCVCLCV